MSNIRKSKLWVLILAVMAAIFSFGCQKEISVEDIYFELDNTKQIVLLVGESLELNDYVEVKPANAGNQNYSLESLNDEIVKIQNGTVFAVSKGSAQIKVISEENPLKQDLMTIVVEDTPKTLSAPQDLRYDGDSRILSFNTVASASSYSLLVNNQEFDLGNSNIFNLSEMGDLAFDNLLKIKVRANAPTYSQALKNSDFTSLNIYQVGDSKNLSVKNGELTFVANEQSKTNVYFGNEQFLSLTDLKIISLKNLHSKYAGTVVDVEVEHELPFDVKQQIEQENGEVLFFKSNKKKIQVNVLDIPSLQMTSSVLSWQNIAFADGYEIYINNDKISTVQTNFFDLMTIPSVVSLIDENQVYNVKVVPILSEESVGVAKTVAESKIKISLLARPVLSVLNDKIVWTNVVNSSAYTVEVDDEMTKGLGVCEFSMAGYSAGMHTISVKAVAKEIPDENDVYYLTSLPEVLEFEKLSEIDISLKDYTLSLNDLQKGEIALVQIGKIENGVFVDKVFDEEIPGDGSIQIIRLNKKEFSVGENLISVIRKATSTSVQSNTSEKRFIQLEQINKFEIVDGVAKAVVDGENVHDLTTIKIEVKGGNPVKTVEIEGTELVLNSTDKSQTDCLSAGEYTAKVFMIGDGENTFSYRDVSTGEIAACQTIEFGVLEVPNLELKNTSEEKLIISQVLNANIYNIYEVEGDALKLKSSNVSELEVDFELSKGTKCFAVQATKTNGTKIYLPSKVSTPITVTRLQEESLTFDSSTNIVTKSKNNQRSLVEGYEFKINGETPSPAYDFSSPLNLSEDSTLTIQALANKIVEGKFYLNSKVSTVSTLRLTKLNNIATLSINEFNQLVITAKEERECDLEVAFSFGTFNSENEKLTDGTHELVYEFTGSSYIVDLLDDDYNVLHEDLKSEFTVKVKFKKIADEFGTYITSEYSAVENLALARIATETSISVNNENKIVVTPNGHSQQFGLILIFNDDTNLTFKSNGTNLLSADTKLPFIYDNGKYLINILDNEYNLLINNLSNSFSLKVKYTHNASGEISDMDSDFSAEKIINLLPKAAISREGESLKITNVNSTFTYKNYALLINNSNILSLEGSGAKTEGNYIVFSVDHVFNSLENEEKHLEINAVQVIVLNLTTTEDNPLLASKGDEMYIQKIQAISLNLSKNNDDLTNNSNNSLIVNFNTILSATENKEYVIEIYNEGGENKKTIRYSDTNVVEGKIFINIDEICDLEGEIVVSGYVATNESYTDNSVIELFNSNISNLVKLTKVTKPQNLKVSDSLLSWDAVENISGYEVYEKVSNNYIKLNSRLLTTNEFKIQGVDGEKEILVKAISNDLDSTTPSGRNFTNSNYSETIVVNKIAKSTASVENGKIKVILPNNILLLLLNDKIKLLPEIKNGKEGTVSLDLKHIDGRNIILSGTTLYVEPYMVMSYNAQSLLSEKLSFLIRVENKEAIDGVFYLNSDETEIKVYGLFKPIQVAKTTNNNDNVEMITWVPSDKNVINGKIINEKYVFKIERTDGASIKPYYSNDVGLKYLDSKSGNYVSYPTYITSTSAIFPAGYDTDNDGVLNEKFEQGVYKISVQAVPDNVIDGVNLCSSRYTDGYIFEILSKISPAVGNGQLVWEKQANASEYVVTIYEQGKDVELLIDTISNPESDTAVVYDFNNTKLNGVTGVLKVVVKAISSRDDAVNSVNSEPIYVYRLPQVADAVDENGEVESRAMCVEDGNLILTASPYFSLAKIEFVDEENNIFVETFDNSEKALEALEALNITNWEDFNNNSKIEETKKYIIKLNNQILQGKDYSINVTLIGNTNYEKGFISSSKSVGISKLTATKLESSLINVEKGTLTYSVSEVYQDVDFNYSFNGATSSTFWHNTALFRLDLTYPLGNVSIYAVDYYAFIKAIENGNISASEYVIVEYADNDNSKDLYAYIKYPYVDQAEAKTLIFNVYKDNTINLLQSSNLRYYAITTKEQESETIYSGEIDYSIIDFTLGGSFTFNVFMLGGDSAEISGITVGHLSAFAQEVKTFNRYSTIQLSTEKGEIKFPTMVKEIEESVVDYPVYRLVVKNFNNALEAEKVFYLYHITPKVELETADAEQENKDLENAKLIAQRFDSASVLTATFVALRESEDGNMLYFDLSQFIEPGIYSTRIQTLAGIGSGLDDADYLLNGQLSSSDYLVHKLSSTNLSKNDVVNGVLTFEQSYILTDGGKQYHENYEVTIINGDKEYVFEINKNNGAKFDDTNKIVSYELPEEILVDTTPFIVEENKEYRIKIRAVAQNSTQDQGILNASYLKNGQTDHVMTFKKASGIESISVSEGVLKWVVKDETIHKSTSIIISFTDGSGNNKTIKLSAIGNDNKVVDDQGDYLYHYYNFGNGQYDLTTTGKVYIKEGFNYAISAYVTSNETSESAVLNSNLFKMSETITRLKAVENIRTENGVLVWDTVEGATSYEVTISGLADVITVEEEKLDLLEKGIKLPIGTYSIFVKAKADKILNAMDSQTVSGFTKLNVVDTSLDGVVIEGFNISWSAVENAQAYNVVLEYTDSLGQTKSHEEAKVENTEFTIPQDIQGEIRGKFSIKFVALGGSNTRLFNSDESIFTSSTDAPLAVDSFYFDTVNKNRFVIKVKEENFTNGDRLLISYGFTEYNEEGNINYGRLKNYITYKQEGYSLVEEDGTLYHYYYLPLAVMGNYISPMAQVVRTGTVASDVVIADDLTFNLFRYGGRLLEDGKTRTPYQIYDATELMNIKYFNSASFILKSTISFEDIDVQASLSENGALISDTFMGTIDGNNNEITFAKAQSENETIILNNKLSFALFKTLTNATIKNLNIGQENRQLILSNTVDSNLSNVLKLSLIATGANNSNIENVDVRNFKIELKSASGTTIIHKEIYLAGLFAESSNTTIKNSNVNFSVDIQSEIYYSTLSNKVYVGAISGKATDTTIKKLLSTDESSANVTFSMTAQANSLIDFAGGLFGYYYSTNKSHIIEFANVVVDMARAEKQPKISMFGGLIGYTQNASILSCEVSGTYARKNISYDTYIGALIGYSNNANITDSGSTLSLELTFSGINNKWIGGLVGWLTTIDGGTSIVSNCYFATYDENNIQTIINSNTEIDLGIYGNTIPSSVSVQGTYKPQN